MASDGLELFSVVGSQMRVLVAEVFRKLAIELFLFDVLRLVQLLVLFAQQPEKLAEFKFPQQLVCFKFRIFKFNSEEFVGPFQFYLGLFLVQYKHALFFVGAVFGFGERERLFFAGWFF